MGITSLWAVYILLKAYESRQSDAADVFYELISSTPNVGTLEG